MTEPRGSSMLIYDIEHSLVQKLHKYEIPHSFQLQSDVELISNLSGTYGALFIRALLSKLKLNEHHLFKWRLEHKLNQFYVLNHYYPGCMPETFMLAEIIKGIDSLKRIQTMIAEGFFIKATLGDASLQNNNWDRTGELVEIIKIPQNIWDKHQPYILQKKLQLSAEYRIHTLFKEIIPALTFVTQGHKIIGNKTQIEFFLKRVLARLPYSITEGAFIAWDVGLTEDGQYFIIEANFTGFHPEYRAGFQTTGYVDNDKYGPIICAWLNKYFRINLGISVENIEESLYMKTPFYRHWTYYNSILNESHLKAMQTQGENEFISAVIYVDHDNVELMKNLLAHFLLVDFARSYNLVTAGSLYASLKIFYWGNQWIRVFNEQELFTEDQEDIIELMSNERRKQISRFHLIRKLRLKSYVLI